MKQWWTNNPSAQTAFSHHPVLAPNFNFYPFNYYLFVTCLAENLVLSKSKWNRLIRLLCEILIVSLRNTNFRMQILVWEPRCVHSRPADGRSNRRRWRESSAIIRTELRKSSKMSSSWPAIRMDTCDATVRKYPEWIWRSGHTVAKVNHPKIRNLLMQLWHFELSLIFKFSAEQSSLSSSCLHNSG